MDSTIIGSIISAVGGIIAAIIGAVISGLMSRRPSPQENGKTPPPKFKYIFFLSFILLVVSSVLCIRYFKLSKTQTAGNTSSSVHVTETVFPTSTESTYQTIVDSQTTVNNPSDVVVSDPSVSIFNDSQPQYVEIGSIQTLGKYDQDGDKNNGAEDIQWLVLNQEGDEILLISVLGLESLPYSRGAETSDWENSSIREWLNGKFYQTAFSNEEKNVIIKKEIEQDINEHYPYCKQGNNTTDHVFLLSAKEYTKYMMNSINIESAYRNGTPSEYAVKEGASLYNGKYCWWWLRTSSKNNEVACTVTPYGVFDPNSGRIRSDSILVRPAMWVKADLWNDTNE